MRISASLPTGVAALLFEAAEARRRLEGRLVARLEALGFGEALLPILDYAECYEPLLSPADRAELYRFVDRDGELLALRADFTPMLARLLAPRAASLSLPLRLFYRGDVVRYQDARPGQPREFYQLGGELLGADGAAAEREMLRLFLELLREADVSPLRVVLGFAGAVDELLHGAADPGALALAVARRERAVARQASPTLLEIVEHGVPARSASLGEAAGRRLEELRALREELAREMPQVELVIDLAEFAPQVLAADLAGAVGERAYYDGLVFRGYAGRSGREVGGGGRYDRLFRRLGAELSAVGFSLGLDRLAGERRRGGA